MLVMATKMRTKMVVAVVCKLRQGAGDLGEGVRSALSGGFEARTTMKIRMAVTVATSGKEGISWRPLSTEDGDAERAVTVEIFGDDDFVSRRHERRIGRLYWRSPATITCKLVLRRAQ